MAYVSWNKGLNKKNHPGLAKIAKARSKRNNFAQWQKNHPIKYASLHKSSELAEFYGTMLGDGCIEKFARTEKLSVSFNSKETQHIRHVKKMISDIFLKEPAAQIRNYSHCINLTLYQKNLSSRLKFPTGEKQLHPLGIPHWIRENEKFLIKCLKGLFETDGDWVIDKKYGMNVMKFTNVIPELLKDVHKSLIGLGFTAHLGKRRVTISRKSETKKFAEMIKFRLY
ncbi:MAG: LAGLIDADG family homing endonuclease [Patescibacteria group bacterium]